MSTLEGASKVIAIIEDRIALDGTSCLQLISVSTLGNRNKIDNIHV